MSLYFPTPAEHSTRTIFPGVTLHACALEKMMLSYVELEPHAEVKEHSHPHEQVGMLLEGRALFFIGEEKKMLVKGDRWRIPGGVKHRVIAQAEGAKALDVFCPIREDYL